MKPVPSPEMEKSAWRRWLAAGAIVIAALIVLSTLAVIYRSLHPVVYKDSWYTLPLLDTVLHGRPSPALLWENWEEHRILFPRILYMVDDLLAGGTGYLLISLNLLFHGITTALIVAALRRQRALSTVETVLFASLAAGASFSLIQSANLLWGFQVAWFLNGLAGALAAYLISGFDARESRGDQWKRVAGAALLIVVACYSLANGMLLWIAVGIVLWKAGASARFLFFWAAAAVLTGFVYSLGYESSGHHQRDLLAFRNVRYLVAYLGNPVSRIHLPIGSVLGIAALGLYGFFALRFLLARRSGFFDRFAFAMTAFVFGTALITSVGRSINGIEQASSSRYYTSVFFFWILLGTWTYVGIRARPALARFAYIGSFAILALLIGGQFLSVPERESRYLKADLCGLSLAAGVNDTATLRYIHHQPEEAEFWEQNAFLKEKRLSIYRERWARTAGLRLAETYRVGAPSVFRARVEEVRQTGLPDRTGRFVSGEIDGSAGGTAGDEFPDVILIAENEMITGFVRTYGRPCPGCFSGYARGPGGTSLRLFALEGKDGNTVRELLTAP